ncbi:MAG: hypothetical protein Q8K71_01765 [Polaromonas sp.]|nr:hypothetical protein [Polaromonas sp.]MDP3752689.1 hypothetical protein [Polaromonas sp.]
MVDNDPNPAADATGREHVLPEDIRRFLLTSVSSVPYLEALLLMRSEPDTCWTARQLSQRLYIGEKVARDLLDALVDSGVAAKMGTDSAQFTYHPATLSLSHLLDRVADCYAHHLVQVTNLIHSRAEKKARLFADAFRWRKDS